MSPFSPVLFINVLLIKETLFKLSKNNRFEDASILLFLNIELIILTFVCELY